MTNQEESKVIITADEKKILKEFLNTPTPNEWKLLDDRNTIIKTGDDETVLDAMYCYEEVTDYARSLLDKTPIYKTQNYFEAYSVVFSFDFIGYINEFHKKHSTANAFCENLIKAY